jgi:hypothetical protein
MKSRMKHAWIITQEGTRQFREVIAVLSARKSGKTVKEYVEWLHALLNYGLGEHLGMAKYHNPTNPYEAEFTRTNTGVPVENLMFCGHNPYLVARLAKDIQVVDPEGDEPILKWTDPDRLVCDEQTLHVKGKIPGASCQAPVHMPLRHLYSMRPRPS